MTFLAPERLWLLVLVPALLVGYLLLQRRRSAYAVRFTNLALLDKIAPRRPEWRRHVAVALSLLSVALIVVAFAKPAGPVEVPRERATIVVTVDVSLSMMAEDVAPTRLDAAKLAAKTFVERLPSKFNVALVAFAGTASVIVSPTLDRSVVIRAINNLRLAESTATGEAIFTSLAAIEQAPVDPDHPDSPPPARVVLLSDGKRTSGRPAEEGARAAADAGVPVYTIAFGTDHGYIVYEGQRAPVPVNRPQLQRVADISGGQAYAAESAGELEDVYADIGSSLGYAVEYREITSRFVGYALVLVLASAVAVVFYASRFS